MKYLLLILTILIFSCEKEPLQTPVKKECQTCTTITRQFGGYDNGKIMSTKTFEACDEELKHWDNTVTQDNNYFYPRISITTCK